MRTLVSVASRMCPRLLWRYRYWSWQLKAAASEPEVALVPALCSPRLTTADIGASAGEYTMHAIPHSRACLAFEPRPDQARAISRLFLRAARVEQVALSDASGDAELRIPKNGAPRSTIETANALEHAEHIDTICVPRRRLDDYAEHVFGFVKIDVEGHEEAVLRGGFRVLRRDRPSLLIEIEERHNAGSLERIHVMLTELGYLGFFLQGNLLRPLEEFHAGVLQKPEHIDGGRKVGVYLNNFLFVQPERLRTLRRWLM